jgi:hypothetical protein
MNTRRCHFLLLIYVVLIVGIVGCQRETPAEKLEFRTTSRRGQWSRLRSRQSIALRLHWTRLVGWKAHLTKLQNIRLIESRKPRRNNLFVPIDTVPVRLAPGNR